MKLRALSLSKRPGMDFFDFAFRRGVLTASDLQKIFFFWTGFPGCGLNWGAVYVIFISKETGAGPARCRK